MLRPVVDQQPCSDGLRQPGESQPRGGPGDCEAACQTVGESGVQSSGSAEAGQLSLIVTLPTLTDML